MRGRGPASQSGGEVTPAEPVAQLAQELRIVVRSQRWRCPVPPVARGSPRQAPAPARAAVIRNDARTTATATNAPAQMTSSSTTAPYGACGRCRRAPDVSLATHRAAAPRRDPCPRTPPRLHRRGAAAFHEDGGPRRRSTGRDTKSRSPAGRRPAACHRRFPSGGQQVSSGGEGSFGWGVRRATRREEPPGAVESGVADA